MNKKTSLVPALSKGEHSLSLPDIFRACIKSLGVSAVCAVLLLFCFSAIAYSTADPNKIISYFAYTALYISAFIGGIVITKLTKRHIIPAAIFGGVYLLFIIAFSLIPDKSTSASLPFGISLLAHLAIILASVIGGFPKPSGNKSRKAPRHKSKAMHKR